MKKFLLPLFLFPLGLGAQFPDTDIWLISLKNQKISAVQNITNRAGYDNQPRFLPDGTGLLYSAIGEDKQAEVYQYNFSEQSATRVTTSAESEFSPTPSADGNGFYYLNQATDSVQTIRFFHFETKATEPVKPMREEVGYFCRVDEEYTVAFLLGEPNQLMLMNLSGDVAVLADDPGRCIHLVPGINNMVRYVQKGESWSIMEVEIPGGAVTKVAPCLEGSEDFAFLPDGTMLMGSKGGLYKWNPKQSKWIPWLNLADRGIADFYRIAVNEEGDKIAVVSFTGKKP